jgi:hypothetical protein
VFEEHQTLLNLYLSVETEQIAEILRQKAFIERIRKAELFQRFHGHLLVLIVLKHLARYITQNERIKFIFETKLCHCT